MARGQKQIEGQITFELCTCPDYCVVQANTLIGGKQALKLNSAKLIRTVIMQLTRDDNDLKPYKITIPELADLLGVSASNLYRDIDDITDDIISHPVFVKSERGNNVRWIKIPWVSRCEYNSDYGIVIKLNDELKPFIVNLYEKYTQYTLDNILAMKSVYAIRIFEMIMERIKTKILPKEGTIVELSIENIRECCDCTDKYKSFSSFRERVIEVAMNEINTITSYRVKYDYIKKGKSVVGLKIYVNMWYHMIAK